jgi:hypothetical protein
MILLSSRNPVEIAMSRMIDLIRESAVPASIVQAAARGELKIPDVDVLEILIYLILHDQEYGDQARATLSEWDQESIRSAAANMHTPAEVLEYLVSADNLQPALLMSLLGNPSVPDRALVRLAKSGLREAVVLLAESARIDSSIEILRALISNPLLAGLQAAAVKQKLWLAEGQLASQHADPENADAVLPEIAAEGAQPDNVLDEEVSAYLLAHAEELAATGEPEFQPIGALQDAVAEAEEPLTEAQAAAAGTAAGIARKPGVSTPARGSALAKISKLDVKGRIQLAFKGNKEERSILVRDGTKLVALSVLDSPKISDAEIEKVANQRNVLESVLRGISMKRRFMKNYVIVRNLVFNPRTPLDVSLGLIKHLQAQDLKGLSASKDVSDTIRKLALKMFKQKMNPSKKTTD